MAETDIFRDGISASVGISENKTEPVVIAEDRAELAPNIERELLAALRKAQEQSVYRSFVLSARNDEGALLFGQALTVGC